MSTPIRGTSTVGWSWTKISLWLLAMAALVALLLGYRVSRQPRLRGTLSATVNGQPVRGQLHGRKAVIGTAKGTQLKVPGRGSVRGERVPRRGKKRGFDLALEIAYASTPKGPQKQHTCKPNSSVVIDGTTFTYQARS